MKTINDIIEMICNSTCYLLTKYPNKHSYECHGDLDYGCSFCFTLKVKLICIENIDKY